MSNITAIQSTLWRYFPRDFLPRPTHSQHPRHPLQKHGLHLHKIIKVIIWQDYQHGNDGNAFICLHFHFHSSSISPWQEYQSDNDGDALIFSFFHFHSLSALIDKLVWETVVWNNSFLLQRNETADLCFYFNLRYSYHTRPNVHFFIFVNFIILDILYVFDIWYINIFIFWYLFVFIFNVFVDFDFCYSYKAKCTFFVNIITLDVKEALRTLWHPTRACLMHIASI